MLISFLFLNKNICTSNKYPQHMFSSINKKNIMWIPPLICSYGDKLEPLSYWVDVQADPSLSWSYRSIVLIVLGFNDTSTLEGHFVSSPREREKRDRRE